MERGICHAFQRGSCRYGSNCKYSHDLSAAPGGRTASNKPCRFFNTPQGCRFGTTCNFSHDNAGANTSQPHRPVNTTTWNELGKWKKDAASHQPLGFGLGKFFNQALHLVNTDDASRQDVIRTLASDSGLNKVLEVANQDFENMSESVLRHLFVTQIVPMFQSLSEHHVMSSPLLERHLGTISNVLYGVTGTRGEHLFTAVVRVLNTLMQAPDVKFYTSLEASLAVLSKVIEYNGTAKVTPCYEAFAIALAPMTTPQLDPAIDMLCYQAKKYLDCINKRLGIGKSIKGMAPTTALDTGAKPQFVLQRSKPGQLSNGRPRHDNDFASIENIQIMPTSEEIQSTHAEYLPLQDPSTWHKQGIDGLLDRHFRLLREDTIGQLRDSARIEFDALQGVFQSKGKLRRHTYQNVQVEWTRFDSSKGLEFGISFDQPPELQLKSEKQRKDWWSQAKRLEGDALICLISSTQAVVFCSVCYQDQSGKDRGATQDVIKYIDERVCIIARPIEMSPEAMAHILGTFSNLDFQGGRSLVEFPGVLLPAFLPTLTALKEISRNLDLPFSDFLAPSSHAQQEMVDIPPPSYAQRRGFRFRLDKIMQDGNLAFDPSNQKQSDLENLTKASTLDNTQASALLSSLSRSFALVQGPPGTGKSYTGVALLKTLVHNKEAGRLGPILVVTFTNHALDQSLENLLDQGISQIVRLGSRSKSERLTELNLRKVAEKVDRTRSEISEKKEIKLLLDAEAKAINQHLAALSNDLENIREHLMRNNPQHEAQLFGSGEDEEGFIEVRYGSPGDRLQNWLHGGRNFYFDRPIEIIRAVANLNYLSNWERRRLINYWLQTARQSILDAILDRVRHFNQLKSTQEAINNELDLRVLDQADVIGVTTSGLARNLNLLRKLSSKVLLCEEAGEVLESHLLTALLPSIEHAILIGDHLQLRPHVQCYDLSQESVQGQQHALDTSLFERLVTAPDGGVRLPFSRLDTQRRMHPDIAELVRSTLYPSLSDAPTTLAHPQVTGLKKRLFWFDHQHSETRDDMQSTSHTNDFEVEMTTALVSHLIKQGTYAPGAIAVLTPYLGQLRKLRRRMQSSFEVVLDDRDVKSLEDVGLNNEDVDGATELRAPPAPGVQKGSIASAVRIATVDNFQGEEAEVVVISLVRSNDQKQCGFLRTSNRINVLLSRAKNGMYIIGNSTTYQHVPMWTGVLQRLQMDENIGDALEISCQRHSGDEMMVSTPDDFVRLAPDGGCILPCTQRLLCGHACTASCHSQVLHDAVKCLAPCTRKVGKHDCSHPCPRVCGDICPSRCEKIIEGIEVELPCGHVKISLPCWQYLEPDLIQCDETVQRTVPGCLHEVTVPCCTDVNDDNFECNAVCDEELPCGHDCKHLCKKCKERIDSRIVETNHGKCRQACGRAFTSCSHNCVKLCHPDTDCGLCKQPCEVRCSHSKCARKCSEPCPPCAEKVCSSSCPHSECSMPCGAPCDWIPCSLRCEEVLACSHQCPSVCGAPCPDVKFCQECADEETKNRTVDLIMMSSYQDVDLDEEPCIFPACGHFYTIGTLDGHLGLAEHYVLDESEHPIALKASHDSLDVDKTRIVCPDCRRSLRDIPRYGRIVRRALLIQSTLKFITWSNSEYVTLYQRFTETNMDLQNSPGEAKPAHVSLLIQGPRDDQFRAIREALPQSRYNKFWSLRFNVHRFRELVKVQEQPFKQVQELVRYARMSKQTDTDFVFDESVILQTRSHTLATSLLLRCDLATLSDVLAVRSSHRLPAEINTIVNLQANRTECEILYQRAHEGMHHLQQAEALIFWARFAALELSWRSSREDSDDEDDFLDLLRDQAKVRLEEARNFCDEHSAARAVASEIEDVGKMLRGGTFYQPVNSEEMREVVAAMATEFSGTGHWWQCENGHPFTIGECGMPMQTARCPQCNGLIGGQGHQAAAGVTHAEDIERELGNLRL
ncbi:hypothetical protein E4T48_05160 [Aureobasidium sp. EXF-10727]|nr:hypothetical protein E4T48_05160 [Aureobasidium sp. EXF-10727]